MTRKLLIIGECEDLMPILEKLVMENNYHIWFEIWMHRVIGMIKELNIDMVLINISQREETRLLCQAIRAHNKTKSVRIILYNPEGKEAMVEGNHHDDSLAPSFTINQIESVLLE